jgi:ethylbenzene dehydrogenase
MAKRIGMVFAAAFAACCSRGPVVDTQQITAVRAAGALPVDDADAAAWASAPQFPATLMVQDVTEPRLEKPGVGLVQVQALHDGRTIAFRLQWDDDAKNVIPESGVSSDAAAIQFSTIAGADLPNAAMGEPGKPVEICYWKAVWQDDTERPKDVDRVASLYPSMAVDHYPFKAPTANDEMARRYSPALAAGNPITARPQSGAVQELVAEGFGSSSVPSAQFARGRGVWANRRWTITIARPLQEGDGRSNLEPGVKTYVAFAVWDGAERQTGSRKMRSGWVPLLVQAGTR